jgi:MinD superfamily P-loop ATPase
MPAIINQKIKIAVASGKGGTGKTLISTNLFHTLTQLDETVLLVDCDAEEPDDLLFFKEALGVPFDRHYGGKEQYEVKQSVPVIDQSNCIYCGRCRDYCSYNAIFLLEGIKTIRVIDDLCHGCGACSYACQSDAITTKERSLGVISRFITGDNSSIIEARGKVGVYSPVPVIKTAIKAAGEDGIVILDSPPGTSCPFIQTVATADFVILVTEPTPFGLSDLKQSVETLKTMNKSYGVIINRAGMGDDKVYSYLIQEQIPLLMEIPFDREIASLYSKGELLVKHKPQWRALFMEMYKTIYSKHKYGNSSNQR